MENFSAHRRTHFLRYLGVLQIGAQEEIKKKVTANKKKGIKERNKVKRSF